MNDESWKRAIVSILEHFDMSEGTTYLYEGTARAGIVNDADPAIRDELRRVLDEYHNRDAP